jgi:hypothetical protein
MDINKETIKKMGTLGGPLRINRRNLWMYIGDGTNKNLTKEKLFGKICAGPLHFGIPSKEEVVLEALHSDTRKTLINELVNQTHLTREEAEHTISVLLKKGILEEIDDPTLGKVLIFKGGR